MKNLLTFTFFSTILLCRLCVVPGMAATESGDALLPETGKESGTDGASPDAADAADTPEENRRFSYAPDLEEKLKEAMAATEKLERNLNWTRKELQSLHSVDDLSALLFRNPEWKIRLDQYETPHDESRHDGSVLPRWEQSSKEIYQALTKRGIEPARMEWEGLGTVFMPER